MVDVRVDDFTIDVPEQPSKTATEPAGGEAAGMNISAKSGYFFVQSPFAARECCKVEFELAQGALPEEVDGAQFGTASIHSAEDMKNSTPRLFHP